MIKLQDVSLVQLLPHNLAADGNVLAAAKALDGELLALTSMIHNLTHMDRLDELSDPETDEYAWQYHIDFYDSSLPLEQRHELVKNSYRWHRRKGTPSAVEELATTVFGSGTVQEWWEYGGEPFHFRVLTSDPGATSDGAERFIQAINSTKNARSVLESIRITTEATMQICIGFSIHIGDYFKIEQAV